MRPALAPLLLLAAAQPTSAFTPTAEYERREVRGFTVLVHPEVPKHPADAAAAFEELDGQLGRIAAAVPAKPLAELRKVRIWVEWEAKPKGAAEFHVAAGWLKDHGYNPDKLRAVEINNLRNFVKWSRQDQPWMVMHELAHAYHFRVLGDKYEPLRAAYRQATDRKLYDAVDRAGRKGKVKAYAATNPAEYFAELTEAYFGRNDFYPFTRSDLAAHDPAGFELMRTAWGDPVK